MNAAATGQVVAMADGLFNTNLDWSIVTNGDKGRKKCRSQVLNAAAKTFDTRIATFASCLKKELKTGTADTASVTAACFQPGGIGQADPKQKVAKSVSRLKSTTDRRCVQEAQFTHYLFPGECIAVFGTPAWGDCVERVVSCSACGWMDVAADLGLDCDLFDDATANDSCSSPGEPEVPGDPPGVRILMVGRRDNAPYRTAEVLRWSLEARGAVRSVEIGVSDAETLLDHFYEDRQRDSRLAIFEEDWDFVVLSEVAEIAENAPELHFEGLRVLADLARSNGAFPLYLTTGSHAPASAAEGTAWRIGNGVDATVIPAAAVASRFGAVRGDFGWVAAATLYAALVGESASTLAWAPEGISAADWTTLTDLALDQWQTDQSAVHYTGDFQGVVQIDPTPQLTPYDFMTSGTSSEAGWASAMSAMLAHEGVAGTHSSIGSCNSDRQVDSTCGDRASAELLIQPYQSLFARSYAVTADSIRTNGGNDTLLQAQVYDRHGDNGDRAGTTALNNVMFMSRATHTEATNLGLAMLPHHINFARMKQIDPTIELTTDGTHATPAVQRGLAAMSWVSRTGLSPTLAGLTGTTSLAVSTGESTIRQLSTLSATGATIDDVPAARPVAPPLDLTDAPEFPGPEDIPGSAHSLSAFTNQQGTADPQRCIVTYDATPPAPDNPPAMPATCFQTDLGSRTGRVTRTRCEDIPTSVYRLVAPSAGQWIFKTHRPAWPCPFSFMIDPTLTVTEPDCGGAVLATNDNTPHLFDLEITDFNSWLELNLVNGQEVFIHQSHIGSTPWASELSIERVDAERHNCADGEDNDSDRRVDCLDPDCLGTPECPDTAPDVDLGSAVGRDVGNGAFLNANDSISYCDAGHGYLGQPDVAVRWVAPFTGSYLFDTIGSTAGESLTVMDGPGACASDGLAMLGCAEENDSSGDHASLQVDGVTAGQELTLWISGVHPVVFWNLNIEYLGGP